MQSTGSISRGKTAQKHNTRECYLSAVREQVESASKQLDTGVSHGRQKTEHR